MVNLIFFICELTVFSFIGGLGGYYLVDSVFPQALVFWKIFYASICAFGIGLIIFSHYVDMKFKKKYVN